MTHLLNESIVLTCLTDFIKMKRKKKKPITLNQPVVWPEITLPTHGLKSVTLPT